jgi:succinate dehydrogenase / fumarate reductase, flavoprotein subunit
MDNKAGVYRTETLLKDMEVELASLRERYGRVWVQDTSRRYNTDLLETIELGFLLDLAETLVVSARARQESRGGHSREDFPARDDRQWLKHTLAHRADGGVKLDYKAVTVTRYQPMERKY